MEFNKVIELRRSNRKFKTEQVKEDDIKYILNCARLAPSAANRQPWHFVVLKNKRLDIAEIMQKQLDRQKDKVLESSYATKNYIPTASVQESIRIIKEAPVLILIFRENNANWFEGDYLSIGCAGENICLAAANIGLGSLWIRDVSYTRNDLAKYLGLDDMDLVTGIAIGYPEEENYRAKKKELEEIVTYID